MAGYSFSEDWFSHVADVWEPLLKMAKPTAMLEIGAYEGRATCFLIERAAAERPIEIHCIDSWQGGIEHDRRAMHEVEMRFDANIALATASAAHPVTLRKHKALSSEALPRLLAEGRGGGFDFAYVDGSHQAPDVLLDAVLVFQLLRVGGYIVFDDYLWHLERRGAQDHYNMPKPAIDAFVNIYRRKLNVLRAPLYQLYMQKVAA
ncbi:MAG TPA: class I SAM-dependent methyltransferase [Sphingomicrobium sp.]